MPTKLNKCLKKTLTTIALAAALLSPQVMGAAEQNVSWNPVEINTSMSSGGSKTLTAYQIDAIKHPGATSNGFWIHAPWTLSFNLTVGEGTANSWGTAVLGMSCNTTMTGLYGDANSCYGSQGFRLYLTKDGTLSYCGTGTSGEQTIATGIVKGGTYGITLQHVAMDSENGDANQLTFTVTPVGGEAMTKTVGTSFNWRVNGNASGGLTPTLVSGIDRGQLLDGWAIENLTLVADNAADKQTGLTVKAADLIPEPATATLSLLALAGLAVRRRRK